MSVYELRTYVLQTHVKLEDYMEAYSTIGLPVQLKILEGFLGYFVTEFGTQNQLNHLWCYEDLEDRRRRRAALAENSEWQRCLDIIRPMIMTMENRLMYPTEFSGLNTLAQARETNSRAQVFLGFT